MPRLYCVTGMNKGQEYELPEDSIVTLGRSDKNSICVLDKKSSRQHCQLYVTKEGVLLEDLKSTNGTKLNNEYIEEPHAMGVGDELAIGQTIFILKDGADGSQLSEAALRPKTKKYESLMQETKFQETKTTSLRKLKTEKMGKTGTGFLSFFEVKDQKKDSSGGA